MAKYFAGGHLRFLEGAWRDDNGDPVDVVEVKHGKWETTDVTQEWDKVQRFGHFHNNPNCKFFYSDEDPNGHDYCPNCGARRDGKDGAE